MSRLSIHEVVNRILPVFRSYGYDGASLTMLSKAAGLSRGSLYHHFPGGKQEMAQAVLARSGAAFSRLIIAPLSHGAPADEKIAAMLSGVKNYYQGDPPICLMNSLTLGEGRELFSDSVAQAVDAWHKALKNTLVSVMPTPDAAGSKATMMIERIQGCLIIARVSGNREKFEDTIDELANFV